MSKKWNLIVTVGDATEEMYLSLNIDATITDGDKEECHGSMVSIDNGNIEITKINSAELVTFGIGIDISTLVALQWHKDTKYREYLNSAMIDYINDNDIYEISI